jgi:integrase
MPARPEGVYADGKGGWYLKATLGRDPLTGKRSQVTRRGFRTAAEAGRARQELLSGDRRTPRPSAVGMTLDELLDLYLDGLDADERLSVKTRFDYRKNAEAYVRPLLGDRRVRDIIPETLLEWQRRLAKGGGVKTGKPLAPNTIRLARAPLAGAFKLAVSTGLLAVNPLGSTPRPTRKRAVPRHWSPEEARAFLGFMEADRTFPIWAFLMSAGLRIGELVVLRWPNVDLDGRVVRVVEFASTIGYEVVPSAGKSRDAIRTIDLDDQLVAVLRDQRKRQAEERLATLDHVESDHVFTRAGGGPYHPQTLSRQLADLSVLAGLPRLTAHGLRHTSATLMLASGVPPKVAAERLGHADATLFTNLYSHVTPTMQRDAADRLGAALFGGDAGSEVPPPTKVPARPKPADR